MVGLNSKADSRAEARFSGLRSWIAILLAGVVAGLAGAALTLLLHLIQHLAFGYTEFSFMVGVEQASSLRRVGALTVGGLVAGVGWWLQRRYARADISVPHALDGQHEALPLRATILDGMLQIFGVGVGASLGREAAPRQVAAAFALKISRFFGLDEARQRRLLGCAAGAGLAAVYNVPLAGALFALELLLTSAKFVDVLAALLCSGVATIMAWPFLSNRPSYAVTALHVGGAVVVWSFFAGPVAAVFATVCVRLMNRARSMEPTQWRVVVGVTAVFATVGIVAVSFPQLPGNGKGPAQLAFDNSGNLRLFLALLLLKPALTALCLAGGARGGMLTPSLATGAVLGALLGQPWNGFWPGSSMGAYAIVAAAALLSVAVRAPLTAIVLAVELTHCTLLMLVPLCAAVGTARLAMTVLRRLRQRLTAGAFGSDMDDMDT